VVYVVQSRDVLGGGLWLNVRGPESWPLGVAEWLDPRPLEGGARFYRVLAVEAAMRGRLLSVSQQPDVSKIYLNLVLSSQKIPLQVDYSVRVYNLVYETVDPTGGRTVASGVLAVPVGVTGSLPLVSYQHGTLIDRDEAPTVNASGERLIGVVLAGTGYAAVVADYLGFGASTGLHPYHHAASEATACVDMLRAARAFCVSSNVPLSGKLFLCGYSQGGHATLALHRELETWHASEFAVTASAPMAGAYDLSGVTAGDFLSGRPMPNPYYFPYLLAAYQRVYALTNELASLLVAPYSTNLPPLLDGQSSGDAINALMPSSPVDILKPEVLAAFQSDPAHPLRLALRDNDLYGWAPVSPLRLYQCAGDLDVPPANAYVASTNFLSRGVVVPVVDPGPSLAHGDCAMPSLLAAKAWFDTLK
jgi:hypothetical protein